MGLTYSIMSPLVVPIVALYSGIALIVYRNQLLYVYIPLYESGGSLWSPVARSFSFALILFQLSMMGVFLLNNRPYCTAFMLPALLITGISVKYIDSTYNDMRALPLTTSKLFDIIATTKTQQDTETPLTYKHPLLIRKGRERLLSTHEPTEAMTNM